MCASRWFLNMIVCALTVSAVGVAPVGAADRDEVNRLYHQMVELLNAEEDASPKTLAEIVQKNPGAAMECLRRAKEKRNSPGKEGEALRQFSDRLEETLYLVSETRSCDEAVAQRLMDRLEEFLKRKKPPWMREENYFILERLAKCCPNIARVHYLLGDQYYGEKRAGLAIDAYRKSLALEENADSRKLLALAEGSMNLYQKQRSITRAEVHDLLHRGRTMGVGGITRKVEMQVSIQRQILFDEWSHRIKDQFAPELKVVGDTLKQDFSGSPGIGVLIEGHTDRRGALDRNMQVSRERAESVKRFLVEHASVDPSRIKTQGFGPSKPYDPRENDAGWALNRRVEFKMINLSAQ